MCTHYTSAVSGYNPVNVQQSLCQEAESICKFYIVKKSSPSVNCHIYEYVRDACFNANKFLMAFHMLTRNLIHTKQFATVLRW